MNDWTRVPIHAPTASHSCPVRRRSRHIRVPCAIRTTVPGNRSGQSCKDRNEQILQGSKGSNLARIERNKSCKDRPEQILQGSKGSTFARIERSKACKDRKEQILQGSKGANLARIEWSKSCKDRREQILQGSKGANLAMIEINNKNFLNNI